MADQRSGVDGRCLVRRSSKTEKEGLLELEERFDDLRVILEFHDDNDNNDDGNHNNNNVDVSGVFLMNLGSIDQQQQQLPPQDNDLDDERGGEDYDIGADSFESLWNLKRIDLLEFWGFRFVSIPNNKIGNLTTLTTLNIVQCQRLICIPSNIRCLQNLKFLTISGCTALETLPCEIGSLNRLEELAIRNNPQLRCLPIAIGNLNSSLSSLSIDNCINVESLSEEIGQLHKLERLHLTELTSLQILPTTFLSGLYALQHFTLKGCTNLKRLDNLILTGLQSLKTLLINRCTQLEMIPIGIQSQLPRLNRLNLSNMPKETTLKFFSSLWASAVVAGQPPPSSSGLSGPKAIIIDGGPNSVLGSDYPSILPGLPKDLETLSLENQEIDDLNSFLNGGLPRQTTALWLFGNPIIDSANVNDRKSFHKLLEEYLRLGEVCWEKNPRLFTTESQFLLYLNRCGRVLLRDNHTNTGIPTTNSIPLSVWPTVLEQVEEGVEGLHNDSLRMEASVLYCRLHGPALLGRQQQPTKVEKIPSSSMTRKRKADDETVSST